MTPTNPAPARPFQFTLRQLLFLVTVVSVAFASYYWLGEKVATVVLILLGILSASAVLALALTGNFYEACGLAFLLLIATAGFLPTIGSREMSRKGYCQNNLHNITIALQNYHDVCGSYPPPFIADANGKPMHSWRALILPFVEQNELYEKYRFDEPWDGPNNRKLHDIQLKIFQCPSQENPRLSTETSYVVVIGPKTMWPAENSYVRNADIIDGLSNTLLLVEVADSGIHWMEPRDLHINQIPMAINPSRGQGISSHHKGGANAGFADGSVRFLDDNFPPADLRAALTAFGRKKELPPTIKRPPLED
ncbi:MAG TPA: DUF1559 domain-containing protein [Pirellulaceae bacterium]|jgi:prepilin-type processing-associated H-X9-DG protein